LSSSAFSVSEITLLVKNAQLPIEIIIFSLKTVYARRVTLNLDRGPYAVEQISFGFAASRLLVNFCFKSTYSDFLTMFFTHKLQKQFPKPTRFNTLAFANQVGKYVS
jgi:hypothetical protein